MTASFKICTKVASLLDTPWQLLTANILKEFLHFIVAMSRIRVDIVCIFTFYLSACRSSSNGLLLESGITPSVDDGCLERLIDLRPGNGIQSRDLEHRTTRA